MKKYMKTVYKIILPAMAAGMMTLGIFGCNKKSDKVRGYDMKQVQAIYKQLDELEAQDRAIEKYCREVVDPLLAQAKAEREIAAAVARGEIPKDITDMTLSEIIEDGLNQPSQPGDDEILKLYGLELSKERPGPVRKNAHEAKSRVFEGK